MESDRALAEYFMQNFDKGNIVAALKDTFSTDGFDWHRVDPTEWEACVQEFENGKTMDMDRLIALIELIRDSQNRQDIDEIPAPPPVPTVKVSGHCRGEHLIDEIIRIRYADSLLPESWVFAGGDENTKLPIIFSVFLLVTEDRKILVDAGCETMPGFAMESHRSPIEVLAEKGYAPTDITDVIITHADHDHIECVHYFPHATVYIQQRELLNGWDYLANIECIHTFDDVCAVTDDITIRKIGGHTVGSCVVEYRKDDKTYVLCGDECYTRYNLTERVPTATSYCPENSQAFIDKYSGEEYTCLLCHEI